MANRLITFTTDFGLSDHFVGVMKGVVAGIAPAARVVDISHEVAPYNVTEAAFVIAQAWPFFPKRTIHVVVIDPDVPWMLDRDELKSKCRNTPFDEARLQGRAVRTIVAGRTVYEDV